MSAQAWIKQIVRALCSLGLIALLLSRVHWQELADLLRQAHLFPLALGALCGGLCPLLIAARTRLLLTQGGISLPYTRILALTWLGQFCNTFLPGSTGGDAVKLLRLRRWVPDQKAAALTALVADRLFALAALLTLAGLAVAFGEAQLRQQLLAEVTRRFTVSVCLAAAGFLVAACLGLWWTWRRYMVRLEGLVGWVRSTAGSLRTGFQPTPALAAAFSLAIILQLLSMTSGWLFCQALQIPVSFGRMMILVPLVLVATLLPVTMNGHGLREYVLLFYFGAWGLTSTLPNGGGTAESVVALSFVMVMADFLWSLPGGLCLLAGRKAPTSPESSRDPAIFGQVEAGGRKWA
ncbi:MAG: flippase-like domain-containing protein [Rhodospirillales bacterium]|nr:flippase-like domain-containing protein [Acetobacter sp.]